jgi:hypothetical protein
VHPEDDGTEWCVFIKPQNHSDEWFTVKIVANGRAPYKANYWLVTNINTGQIGYARDYAVMRENRPSLHDYVELILIEYKSGKEML